MANLIPDGTFAKAVALDTDGDRFGRSGAPKNTAQVLLYFQILEGEYKGRRVPWFGFFTPDTVNRTMESLRYCGWKGTDLRKLGPLDQVVEIEIEVNDYNDRQSNRVKWVNRPGGGAMKLNNPMDANALRDFAARMQKYAAAVPEVDGDRASRDDSQNDQRPDEERGGGGGAGTFSGPDDDIPF